MSHVSCQQVTPKYILQSSSFLLHLNWLVFKLSGDQIESTLGLNNIQLNSSQKSKIERKVYLKD